MTVFICVCIIMIHAFIAIFIAIYSLCTVITQLNNVRAQFSRKSVKKTIVTIISQRILHHQNQSSHIIIKSHCFLFNNECNIIMLDSTMNAISSCWIYCFLFSDKRRRIYFQVHCFDQMFA